MKIFTYVVIGFLLLMPNLACSATLEEALNNRIVVEKLTGRGDEYGISFSGWVGSLNIDLTEKKIFISEFTEIYGKISVVAGVYGITKLEQFKNSIDFECADLTDLTPGIEWKGKIWVTDDGVTKIEMIQKQSPRRWVNLGEHGKKFLHDNKIAHLDLGA